MQDTGDLKGRVRSLLVESLMLQVAPEEIADDTSLFGPDGLGLDSVDALQLVVALDKHFGLKITDPAMAREVLFSINTIVASVDKCLRQQP
ncbi:MAG: acyl carrier protein [Pedosphaera parvula]|nr:acyl carrier protein [Pedosphaera parvula]